MLTARALQGAASIKAQNVGFQLRLRLRRDRLNQARQRLAEVYNTTKNDLASVSEPNIRARQGGRRLAPSAGAIAPKLGVMRKTYLSLEA